MSKYPENNTAQSLARHGRYGDSHLLHVNSEELKGIAALVPGGKLTINPVTGLPEAFSFKNVLKTLVPIAAGIAAPYALPGISAAVAGGIGSGLATAAITGDIERGLVSGIMGAGLGAAGGAAREAGAATAAAGAETAGAMTGAMKPIVGSAGTGIGAGTMLANPAAAQSVVSQGAAASTSPFSAGLSQMMKSSSMIPFAVGSGQLAAMDQQDYWDEQSKKLTGDKDKKLKSAYDNLQRGIMAAQPFARRGPNPARNYMSYNTPSPTGYAEGGMTRTQTYYGEFDPDDIGGPLGEYLRNRRLRDGNRGYGGIDPVTVQQNLRGDKAAPPPPGFMPGFNPEYRYFQPPDPTGVHIPGPATGPAQGPQTGPEQWSQIYAGFPSTQIPLTKQPYFDSILPPEEEVEGMAEGGPVTMNTPMGPQQIAGGGIAAVPTEFTQQQGGGKPSEQDVMMVASAILGQTEQSEQVIEAFVSKYGPEVFQAIREIVLQSVNPGAQTQGMIEGQGDGMADQIPGTIGGGEPVAVSQGEFIVPADVVSGLGNGSSEAGAQQLDGMMNNVRQARQGGMMNQPPPIDPKRLLPA